MNEICWICKKEKGQPPERCPGHYEATPTGIYPSTTLERRMLAEIRAELQRLIERDSKLDESVEVGAARLASYYTLDTFLARLNPVLERELAQVRAERDAWEKKFGNHTSAVGEWLTEMHAIMIDPVENWSGKVEGLCAALKQAALRDRQRAQDQQDQLTAALAREEALRKFAQAVDNFIWTHDEPGCSGHDRSVIVGFEEKYGLQITVDMKFQPTELLTGPKPAKEEA